MSHSYRLLAVGIAVALCHFKTPAHSFTLNRENNITHDDQHPEDSIALEVRNDLRRPNDIEITKEDALIPTSDTFFRYFKFITTIQDQVVDSSIDTTQNIEFTTEIVEPTVNKETTTIDNEDEHSDNNKHIRTSYNPTDTETTPSWKKYTAINRKVVNSVLNDDRTEGMLTDETGVPRQDSKSGDIPSLNQIKNFLFPSSFFKTDVRNDTTSTVGVTEESFTTNPDTTGELTTPTKSNSNTVESKRGGFLDFSLKSLFEDNSDKKENSQENNTSKPKGRRLSWRFGSRYRGKEDNSAEKSKERSRFRFRNNKDRKQDNNETKESKEEYSREIDSRETDKQSLQPIEKNNKNESEYKTKAEVKTDIKNIRNQNEKEILAEWNQFENNNGKSESKYSKDIPNKKEKESSKEILQSKEKTTTEINIWNTGSAEKTYSHEKDQRTATEFKIPTQSNEGRKSHTTNNSEKSRDNHYKNRSRDRSENNTDEDAQLKSQSRNNKDKIKERNNEQNRTDKNGRKDIKEYETYKSQKHNMNTNAMDPYISQNPSNYKFNEGQTNRVQPTETNHELDQKVITKDYNPTIASIGSPEIVDVKQENNNSEKQVTIEYLKQFLSTIDEEEENEGNSPTIEESSTIKPIDIPNIVAVNYSPDFKLNDIESTTGSLDSYEPFKIPNLLISLPSPKNKVKQNIDLVETTTKFEVTEKLKHVSGFNNSTSSEKKFGVQHKDTKNTEAIVQMHEDDRREELLKEEVLNNNEESFRKFNDDSETTNQTTIPVKIYEVNKKQDNEKLSVKPLTFLEKFKTTILYPVGANYKPLKKIEVQPPKPFMRDPDDNSWRNESLSSLGIVFKPKNSSKPFTQVLKNKTETEWNSLMEKQNKSETPDLRERLEKIAEMRKSKKKKTDAYGNVLYNDYDESLSKEMKEIEFSTTTTTTAVSTIAFTTTTTIAPTTEQESQNISKSVSSSTTDKPKKVFNVAEYYDTSDDDDADYLSLAKIDLKKFTVPIRTDAYVTPPTWLVTNTKQEHNNNNDRKPTLQYFPPLTTQKGMFRDYDTDFHKKMGAYTETEPPTNVLPVSHTQPSFSIPSDRKGDMFTPYNKNYNDKTTTEFIGYEKPGYMTQAAIIPDTKEGYTVVTDDGSYNRAADIIKHYRDFLNAVAKDHEEDINEDYIPYTNPPTQGVTVSDIIHKIKSKPDAVEHYDYDNDFRKDVLQRFVHNFNQNSERFKSGLPLLYNNSVIHGSAGDGRDVASSRTYLSRMLTRPSGDCDNNATVELSPAYELHYYVPEEEEKEQVDPKLATLPYQYRL